jgi:hypothetical protein
VETYLRNRGISIIPPVIRFLPLLQHREYGWPFPTLAAGIQDVAGAFAAIAVTWLCADGSDKAPAEPARKIYGPYRSSAVRLAPDREKLVICEGIETGLSIAQACPQLAVWCALSAKNLPQVNIPESAREVIIAADADEAGEQAAQAAARRFYFEGHKVRISKPRSANDFNDRLIA